MINEIKSKISCLDYLARHGIFVKNGGRCVSPLRPGAKNPTSFFCDEKQWYDFGAATGGDVIDLAAKLEYNGDVGEAIRGLARELGIRSQSPNKPDTWKHDIQNLCNRAAAYHAALTPEDFQYLAGRGLSRDDIDRLMIGRVTDGYLKGRLFLPYFKNGYVCYYATRALPGGSFPENKYMKASLSECDSYEHVPWGLHTLPHRSDVLVIAEGYFDAAAFEREGYAVLSPITGNFSATQWPEVIAACRMFPRVMLIFDNDAISHAGDGFTARASQRLFQARIPFLVAHTPQWIKDVNDYYTGGGSLETLLNTAQDGLKYMVAQHTNAVELKNFIMSINRFTDITAITEALYTPEMQERFAPAVLKSIEKSAATAPSENIVVNEIIHKHDVIYVDNVGFYEWNDRVWQKISDETVRGYIDRCYGNFSTAQRVGAVCKLLKSRTVCDVVFDRNPVFTFQNGTLEIETGKFREFQRSDYCSIIMDYDYDAEARCPEWERFIEDVTDEEPRRQENLQFIAGYSLLTDCRYQKAFFLVGSGGNGKSVYLDILQKLFGDANVSHVEPSGFTQDFQRICLKDSLLNIGSDINSDLSRGEIREWMLKIADGASIQACYKGKDYVAFAPRCKLVYACNALPTAEIINGLNRRMQFVDFPCQYVETPDPKNRKQKQRDISLQGKLLAELPGIFNWAYEGYKLLNTVGYFTDTPEQYALLHQFEQTSNPVMVFCEDHTFEGEMSRNEIYGMYKDWCETTGHKPMSREKFFPRFCECFGDKIEDPNKVCRRNRQLVRMVVFS